MEDSNSPQTLSQACREVARLYVDPDQSQPGDFEKFWKCLLVTASRDKKHDHKKNHGNALLTVEEDALLAGIALGFAGGLNPLTRPQLCELVPQVIGRITDTPSHKWYQSSDYHLSGITRARAMDFEKRHPELRSSAQQETASVRTSPQTLSNIEEFIQLTEKDRQGI